MNKNKYIIGTIGTKAGQIPQVSTSLSLADKLGAIKVRLSFNRMDYKIEPGLYAIGNPTKDSNVFVSANYKLSFDVLRKELAGLDAWILVLDTKGINVWCAAGEGTFGTEELVNRIKTVNLSEVVSHKNLIVPQLGAVGISVHKVRQESGFNVVYGPVRANDIPEFLKAGMKTSPEMRKVNFYLGDRAKLVGVELVTGLKYFVLLTILLLIPSLIKNHGVYFGKELPIIINFLLAYLAGTLVGPLLLPWLPGRAFAVKGAFAGFLVFLISYIFGYINGGVLVSITWLIFMMTVSSFILMNFTGASTYTSFSGVKKEMKTAVPFQAAGAVVSVILSLIILIKS